MSTDPHGPITNFGGVSSFGAPVTPYNFTGTHFWVKPSTGNDSLSGLSPDLAVKTLAHALSLATANKNDVVHLVAESNTAASTTDYQSAALDWNKDGVHLIGENCGPFIGHRSRIAQLSTVLTIEDLFTVSADNCLIANIEIFQGVASSTATSPRAMVVSGQRNHIHNCQISGMGDTSMDSTGARSLAVIYPGSENLFTHCYIGLDTTLRATNVIEVEVIGTGASTRVARTTFEDCVFNTYTSSTAGKILNCSYVDRFVLLKNCMLCAIENITSAVVPTGAISADNVNGKIWLLGGGVFGPADITTADDTNVRLLTYSGLAANVVDQGVAKATDVA